MKRPPTARDKLDRGLGKLRRCLSFWRRALLVFVVSAIAAVPLSLSMPRSYKSEAVILYQETIRSADLTGGGGDTLPDSARRLGARLREALVSRASLHPIVVDLHLYPHVVEQRGVIDAVDEMRKHITFRAREGDTFEVAFEGTSPDEVQEVTRRLADSLVKEAAVRRAERAKTLKEFVDVESERTNEELKVKEAALASFLAVHPEFKRRAGSDLLTTPATPTEGLTLAALEQRATRIERELATAPAARPVTAAVPAAPEPQPDSPDVLAARRDLADKLTKYTDRHPDVLGARARLRSAEAAQAARGAEATAGRTGGDARPATPDGLYGARDDREALRAQLIALQIQIAARRARATAGASPAAETSAQVHPVPIARPPTALPAPSGSSGSVDNEVAFRRLQREVNDTRERQRQLDDTQFKVSIAASSVMNDRNVQVSVLDPAYRPTHPISRPRSVLVGAALLLCLVLAMLIAIGSAWLDDRIHDRAALEHLDMVPLLAVIPRPRPALPAPRRSRPNG